MDDTLPPLSQKASEVSSTLPADPTILPPGLPDAATLAPVSIRSAGTLIGGDSDSSPSAPTLVPDPSWSPRFDELPVTIGLPAIDGYEMLAKIGRGGMGVVYKARHIGLNRVCALKMMLGEHVGRSGGQRFRHEAETVARLKHPNIVSVHAIGNHRGNPFVEWEYLEGGSLDGKLWEADRAATMMETLANAVGEAHRLGVVHRDLKPANVLLTLGGTPKLADFGLAKSLHSESHLTVTGTLTGTPEYMAPEQALGKDVSPATDVHMLGIILYELFVGNRP